ncbi:WD40-repeat-containing domain protein [Amanita muscaria]
MDSVRCATEDTLCLSLDWSNRRTPQAGLSNLVVSLSNGSLCLLRSTSHGELLKTDEWLAHEYEAWIAAWDCWDTNVIYSGGDDLALKFWDIRQGFDRPFFTNKRFEAGVTTIQSHPHVEHLMAVGRYPTALATGSLIIYRYSYNNTVYLFDRRKASTALSEVPVGGGVWRVKWNPHNDRKGDLLVACMQDGFKVLRYDDEIHSSQVIQRFDGHKSLAYGIDWSYQQPATDSRQIIGSCSFYDHLLHMWKA